VTPRGVFWIVSFLLVQMFSIGFTMGNPGAIPSLESRRTVEVCSERDFWTVQLLESQPSLKFKWCVDKGCVYKLWGFSVGGKTGFVITLGTREAWGACEDSCELRHLEWCNFDGDGKPDVLAHWYFGGSVGGGPARVYIGREHGGHCQHEVFSRPFEVLAIKCAGRDVLFQSTPRSAKPRCYRWDCERARFLEVEPIGVNPDAVAAFRQKQAERESAYGSWLWSPKWPETAGRGKD